MLWFITALVMIVALAIIAKSLDAESRAAVNFKEIALHITVFTMFAVDVFVVSILMFMISEPDKFNH